jgi:type II secretory pathway pseudopilin PulG
MKQSTRGFTLIELLLYVGIASLVMLTITTFLMLIVNARVKNQTLTEVEQQGVYAMETITQLVRNSIDVRSPVPGASDSALTLVMADVAVDPTSVALTSGALELTEGSGSAVALTNGRITISNLTFTNLSRDDDLDSIQVEFTITYSNSSGQNTYDYEETFQTTISNR